MADFCGVEILHKIEQMEKELSELKKKVLKGQQNGVGANGQIIQIANLEQTERKLEAKLQGLNAMNEKLEKEMGELKDQLGDKNSELQEKNSKNDNLEKEMRVVKDQLNEVNQQIDQIVIGYVRTLPAADSDGYIHLENGYQYTPEMEIFLRYGATHFNWFLIWRHGTIDGFVGYPANFFNDLIKYYYETKLPAKAVRNLRIDLPFNNPAPWPTALLQPQTGKMDLEELGKFCNDDNGIWVKYILRNKHNSDIEFKLWIHFEGDAKCYQQMTAFVVGWYLIS